VSPAWLATRERGSLALIRFMIWLSKAGGYGICRLLIYPISLYFVLLPGRTRPVALRYLTAALGRPADMRDRFRHIFAFAASLLDRMFLARGELDRFRFEVTGLAAVEEHIRAGEGCILLGSHLGSFQALRMLGDLGSPVRVRPMMHETGARVPAIEDSLAPNRAADIIRLGRPQTLLEAREALQAGELVGILADRVFQAERAVVVDFLGRPAPFPLGPFLLAGALQAPVFLAFAIRTGWRHYSVEFVPFANGEDMPRRADPAVLRRWVQSYADALADRCRAHPYEWFNFFDVWEAGDAPGQRGGSSAAFRSPRGARGGDRADHDRGVDAPARSGAGEPGVVP
jgi:predicted LPLAT superfamily acyltransferase